MGTRELLNQYIQEVKEVPFKWGVNDCLIFTNEAWKRMYGHGWAEDWLGRYMTPRGPMKKNQLIKEFGFTDFTSAVDERLTRITSVPPRGSLVTTKKTQRWFIGCALGISVGTKAAFLSDKGVIYLPLDDVDKSWVK